ELAGGYGQTLFEICARLTMKYQLGSSRQAISQHLEVLIGAGLVTSHREGRYKFHHRHRTTREPDRPMAQPRHEGDLMRINLTSVLVHNQDEALRFYTEVLGFVKKTEVPLGES